MREIKFRGYSRGFNKWFYGNYIEKLPQTEGKPTVLAAIHDISTNALLRVVPESVGQFTGLNDKNGVEIYEGDVVMTTKFKDIPNVVEYIMNGFYRTKTHDNGKKYLNPIGNCEVQIIGNIYQNPELIK